MMKSGALLLLFFFFLLVISTSTAQTPAIFNCSSRTPCQALIDHVPINATTYSDIRTLFGVSNHRDILAANNLALSTPPNASVAPNQKVRIPFPCVCRSGTGISDNRPRYTVKAGDSFDFIARTIFSNVITYQQLASANTMLNPDLLEVGVELLIPLPCSCDDVDGMKVVHYGYVVLPGDNVSQIASDHNTTELTLLGLNGLANADDLQAGAVIDVPLRDFGPTVNDRAPESSSKNNTGIILGIIVSIVLVSIICAFIIFYLSRKRPSNSEEDELLGIENRPNTFSYAELRSATGDFSPTNKLGEGGFGPVYKGMLSDGREIAVKKLLVTSHQGKSQFVAEISIISAVRHRNLVKLYGCCIEAENRLLVYEYLQNKSLDQALFGESDLHLDWPTRCNICLGAARALAYLHEESTPRIVHRDVKASNILLDSNLNPKISDFGLAKLYDDRKTHISTRVAGTIGYLAPEYAMRGHLTEKADVFGFGVVALEILCGRPNSDSSLDQSKIYLLEWAWSLYENDRGLELVDPTLTTFNKEEANRMLGVALLCTQASPLMRPPMSRVVAMLSGDIEVSTVASKPSYLTDWQFNDMSTFMSEDGNSQYLSSKALKSDFDSSSNTSMVRGIDRSQIADSGRIISDVIGEGR